MSRARLRVAYVGVGHWHLPLYLDPALTIADVDVVGVSDPDASVARAVGDRVGCTWATDVADLCGRVRPDFVFALGQHVDMARTATLLVQLGVPFAMEKPCGMDGEQVAGVAREVRRAGAFAAIPFVWRQSELLAFVQEAFAEDPMQYGLLRWIAGPLSRYVEAGCDWMLDPARSGGGCAINLGVHFIDLATVLLGPGVRLESAVMSNAVSGAAVEDYAMLAMEADGRKLVSETGYLFPAPSAEFDLHFSLVGRRRYLIAPGPDSVALVEHDGGRATHRVKTTNVPHYRVFVEDVLERVRNDRAPVASMDDMEAVMRILDEAYAIARPRAERTAADDR